MKTINIQGIDKKIPSDWTDITIDKYLKITECKHDDSEEFQGLILVSHYTDIPVLELKRMPLADLHKITEAMAFINTEIPQKPCTEFGFGEGKNYEKFYVIQNLLEEESQYYFALEAVMEEAQHNAIQALPKLMAIMCRKDRETLDMIKIPERAEYLMKHMNIVQGMGIQVFFSSLAIGFEIRSQYYLNREAIVEQKRREVESSFKKLDGMGWRGRFLARTLRRLMNLFIQDWKTSYGGLPSNKKQWSFKTTFKRLLRSGTTKK